MTNEHVNYENYDDDNNSEDDDDNSEDDDNNEEYNKPGRVLQKQAW